MRRLGWLVFAAALLTAAPASAATFTVTGNADVTGTCNAAGSCPSIRAALAAASANGAATDDLIVVPANTYQLGSVLTVNSQVAIRGAGARSTVIRGSKAVGAPLVRVFAVLGVRATIQALTMENGADGQTPGGNLRNVGGTVTLDHVRVTGGQATNGGGVANENALMTIRNSLIDSNQATEGGAVYNTGGSLTVHDSTISSNTATTNAGIRLVGPVSTANLVRVTVARNDAGADSGAIAADVAGAIRLRASILSDNGGDSGGAFDCAPPLPASEGANLETEADCGFAAAGDLQNAGAAGLSAALVNAGGQTNVFSLAANSPAINRAGVCSGADQRDLGRPQGGLCDSGAYEVDQAPDTTVVADPPVFRFSSSEPGVRFECRIDRRSGPGTFFACSSPLNLSNLRFGSYTLFVRAVDGSGRVDATPAATGFTIPRPRPQAGRSVVVDEVRGRVRVKVPGGRYVNLNDLTEIPDGSTIDARNGVVLLQFEPRPGATPQKARFWDGIFRLHQRRRIMELTLVEKLARCKAQSDASAAAKRKRKRRLWGSGRGRFRTRGQYSSATVRGTKWLTQDTCAGTLTRVVKGKVSVRDRVLRKTIRLKKGQRYLARSPAA
ncbi:MAG TPA: choice-of-anchor Q domain-containing protein [Solirubrobacteraceae bacterium]|jgi:hypothetical protein|nr:choice-of-anchor Q domain-containing protein [Solirubrobacteraceae bacterium]